MDLFHFVDILDTQNQGFKLVDIILNRACLAQGHQRISRLPFFINNAKLFDNHINKGIKVRGALIGGANSSKPVGCISTQAGDGNVHSKGRMFLLPLNTESIKVPFDLLDP